MSVWAVFFLVFLYYLIRRRARWEYGILLLFSTRAYLANGSSICRFCGGLCRLYGSDDRYVLGRYVGAYVAGLFAVRTMVRLWPYARAKLADLCYAQRMFDLGMLHPIFLIVFLLITCVTIAIGAWGPMYIWPVFVVVYFVLWVIALTALIRHRLYKSKFAEGNVATDRLEGQLIQCQVAVSHRQLDIVRI